jgi:hypothetical protein
MSPHETEGPGVVEVDAAVQAQVALRLIAGLVDQLVQAGLLEIDAAVRIAESAAVQAEDGVHSQRMEIATALRAIVAA